MPLEGYSTAFNGVSQQPSTTLFPGYGSKGFLLALFRNGLMLIQRQTYRICSICFQLEPSPARAPRQL